MICVPIVAKTEKEAIQQLRKAERVGDVVELRLDYLSSLGVSRLFNRNLSRVIVTVRKKSEGGHRTIGDGKRLLLYEQAIKQGVAYVDVELSSKRLLRDVKGCIQANGNKTKLIISHHNFSRTDKGDVQRYYRAIKKLQPAVVKIVTLAKRVEDNLIMLDLLQQATKEKVDVIAFCMGELGELSRILCVSYGSFLTFGLLDGNASAAGQLSVAVMKDQYRVMRLRKPKLYGLVGNPVSHSKGYLLHNFWIRRKNEVYVNFLVEDVARFVRSFRTLFSGLSVTIPHKESILSFLDTVDIDARSIGAVNTVVKKGKKLFGYNTDVIGFTTALGGRKKLRNKRALVVGSGGVARALVYGLRQSGAEVTITNRTFFKAKRLARLFRCRAISVSAVGGSGTYDFIVNATSVGMVPSIAKKPLQKSLLKKVSHAGSVVFDAVYTPITTSFLSDAKSLGLETVSGLQLFFHQAREQFKLWHGVYPQGGYDEING